MEGVLPVPVPNYLKDIAYCEKTKNKITSFNLKCQCGCFKFDLYESYLDKKEKEICKPYYDALRYSVTGGCFSSCTKDENGILHRWVYFTHNMNGPKEEVFIPPAPAFAHITSYKVKCTECDKEYIIYDSRYHGYYGKFCKEISDDSKNYIPHYRKKNRRDNMPVKICIKVENELNIDEFKRDTDIECSFEDYTEAFTWFVVYTIDNNDKKRKILDFETD